MRTTLTIEDFIFGKLNQLSDELEAAESHHTGY